MPSSAVVRVGSAGAGLLLWVGAMLGGCGAKDRGDAPPASRPGRGAATEELGAQGNSGPCLAAAPSWERVDALLERSCRGCHSLARVGDIERGGAPLGIDFDTEAQVRRHGERIRIRAVQGGNMPPSGALQDCSRNLLGDYLHSVADAECMVDCDGRTCGDDGCGGSCGGCDEGFSCTSAGVCGEPLCTPNCGTDVCGDDGCGGSCGECASGQSCDDGQCTCEPQCDGRNCGPDGCGGSCGTCAGQGSCDLSGQCLCQPDCTDKQCGDDGCGGSCGRCSGTRACDDAQQCVCTPDCAGKECGNDGCGGSCGSCEGGLTCNTAQGSCVSSCTPDCSGRSCGDDGCDGSCGDCEAGLGCEEESGSCVCQPDCTGKQCGDDGCGGECGPCSGGLSCDEEHQCVCTPDCNGRTCGSDGCGGSCGSCEGSDSCDAEGQCVCAPQCTAGSCGDDGCGGTCGCEQGQSCSAGTCAWPEVSYATDVFPLFESCAGGCHAGMMPKATLNLEDAPTAHMELVGAASVQCPTTPKTLVVPGDVSASYLINKLTGVGMCDPTTQRQMPRGTGAVLLTEQQIDVVRAWIATGAEND